MGLNYLTENSRHGNFRRKIQTNSNYKRKENRKPSFSMAKGCKL